HKIASRVTPGTFRIEMIRLAADGMENVYICDEEVKRSGYTYTVDTLVWLRNEIEKKLPGEEYKLYYIIGTDVLRDLPNWKNCCEVFKLCEFIAVKRPGEVNTEFEQYKKNVEDMGATVHEADLELKEVSSSEIRKCRQHFERLTGLVPESVEQYIKDRRLYQQGKHASLEEIKADLKERLSEEKYLHSIGVMEECERLATEYGVDIKKCRRAGLLHDCAKELTESQIRWVGFSLAEIKKENPYGGMNPRVVHAFTGRILAERRYGVHDKEVLDAIETHVTGKPEMGLMSCIVYIADYTEKNRKGEVFERIRKTLKEEGLYRAIQISCDATAEIVIKRGEELDINTIATRNWAIIKQKTNN
ncbi:MAG: bis(5'-nucleosyl)-tetraphosphatase (symmetrical) YqeK, partial [Clostridia bacterium]|nr:bis(5'-nucleosyl)-tetraphosphatase (symmetrical) YqeK [Clostridia bacterium]